MTLNNLIEIDKIASFSEHFFAILGCDAHLESEFLLKLLKIDQAN